MGKIAILVDAGYLLAAGAELISGSRDARRHSLALDCDELVLLLTETASMCEPSDELLRVYWYDAALSPDKLTEEQGRIADKRNCKLRLGTLNRFGGQKGVDTLMVMDVLALSRNKAISSILIVTGDDDLRPALEEAQEFGVRVHLLGIQAAKGFNQSQRLQRECDSYRDWGQAETSTFLSISEPAEPTAEAAPGQTMALATDDPLGEAIQHALDRATPADLALIAHHSDADYVSIPAPIYNRLLGRYGANLGRRVITEDEKKIMRQTLYERARGMLKR